jgi:hypothetical protein
VFRLIFREIDGTFWGDPKPNQSENTKIGPDFYRNLAFSEIFGWTAIVGGRRFTQHGFFEVDARFCPKV